MIFGSQYLWPKPASEAEIEAVEKRLGLRLPDALRAYYKYVANGGPGPSYGMYALDKLEVVDSFEIYIPEEIMPQQIPLLERLQKQDGTTYPAVTFLTMGCSYDASCIADGPNTGRLILSFDYEPYFMPDDGDFLIWYERWLDEFIDGLRMSRYEEYYSGDQSQLRERFRSDSQELYYEDILYGLDRFPQLEEGTRSLFVSLLSDAQYADQAGYILFRRGEQAGLRYILQLLSSGEEERRNQGRLILIWTAQNHWDFSFWEPLFTSAEMQTDCKMRKRAAKVLADQYRSQADSGRFKIREIRKNLPNMILESRINCCDRLAAIFDSMSEAT